MIRVTFSSGLSVVIPDLQVGESDGVPVLVVSDACEVPWAEVQALEPLPVGTRPERPTAEIRQWSRQELRRAQRRLARATERRAAREARRAALDAASGA